MEVRQSSLLSFTQDLLPMLHEAARQRPDSNVSLDLMHSRMKEGIRTFRMVTLISPETGAMSLMWHDEPTADHFKLIFVCNTIGAKKEEGTCWMCRIPFSMTLILDRQRLAKWMLEVFTKINFTDTEEVFVSKMNELKELDDAPIYTKFGDFYAFDHNGFDL